MSEAPKTYTCIEYSVSGTNKKGQIKINDTFLKTHGSPSDTGESDMTMIMSVLASALEKSDIFRKMLDEWFTTKNEFIIDDSYMNHSEAGLGWVGLNMAQIQSGRYIGNNGDVQPYSLAFVLIHELGHALTGREDNAHYITPNYKNPGLCRQGELSENGPEYKNFVNPENGLGGIPGVDKIRGDHTDYRQPNATFVNTIYEQLGIPQINSYFAQADSLTPDDSYTNGTHIDRSIVLAAYMPVDWDSSTLMDKAGNYTTNNTSKDLLIGDERDNTLKSGGGDDWLYGGDGNDHLYGGSGINHLYGGEGRDTYYIESTGFGDMNVIEDSDNNGVLVINGKEINRLFKDENNSNLYYDDYNFQYVQRGNNVWVFRPAAESTFPLVIIKNLNLESLGQSGGNDLGLSIVTDPVSIANNKMRYLSYGNSLIIANSTTSQDDQIIGFTTGNSHDLVAGGRGIEVIYLGGGNDQTNGGLGNDVIDGGSGNDVIMGSAFNASEDDADNDADKLTGGADRDLIYGGIGNDYIITGTTEFEAGDSEGQGDWAVGGTGNDFIFGSKDDDFLNGGAGEDYICGGGGHDIILGDGNIIFGSGTMTKNVNNATYSWNANSQTWSVLYGQYSTYLDPNSFNWSAFKNNGEMPDFTLTRERPLRVDERLAEGGGSDFIQGGAGDDWIAGQTGADYIDGGADDDIIYGSDLDDQGNYGDVADDRYQGDHDTLIGGSGADKIYGGSGNDFMYSDEVEYTEYGGRIIKGDGVQDFMHGGSGNDTMYAGTGGDQLFGQWGDDALIAGESSNGLFDGGEGDDTFFIGTGNGNVFEGGEDHDTYHISRDSLINGTGHDTISDSDDDWSLAIDFTRISGDTPGLKAVANGIWRIGGMEIAVLGNDLMIYAVGDGENSIGIGIGKYVLFENVVNKPGFIGLNLPEYDPGEEPENRAPVISGSISDQSGAAGQLISFVIPASMFSDPDGDTLSYSLTLADGSALPSWLTFNAGTMTVSGTAPGAFDQTLRLEVSDGKGGVTGTSFGLSITPASTNGAPEVSGSIADQSVKAGQLLNFGFRPDELFSDPDDDPLTYRAALANGQELPAWLTFDAETGTFSGTPPANLAGQILNVKVWAYDGQAESESVSFVININPGDDLNLIEGTGGDDTLNGTAANDYIKGLDGNDTLKGNAGNDILDGGAGDDWLEGGAGEDVYVFGQGYGHDTVYARDNIVGGRDTVRLAGLNPGDVEFSIVTITRSNRVTQDLVITIKETGETLTIYAGADPDYGGYNRQHFIKAVEFGDGTVWEYADVLANGLVGTAGDDVMELKDSIYGATLFGLDGNDTLKGNTGNDVLDGGAGDDWLEGKAGEDVYVFGKGYGHDTVYALDSVSGGRDTVRLAGLNPDDVEFSIVTLTRYGVTQDLVITIKETGETMTIYAGADPVYGGYDRRYYIRTVEFGDGTVWDYADIFANGIVGTAGDDVITIKDSNYSGALYGRDGNDTLTGNNGADQLYGGDGDDKLYGNAGNDVLDGGAGDDWLEGGAGEDVYVFGKGYGHDTVYARDNVVGGRDTVRLVGLNPDDVEFSIVTLTRSGVTQDLVITIKETGETLTIYAGADPNYGGYNRQHFIKAVEFGDGTVWEYADVLANGLVGTAGDDVMELKDSIYGATLFGLDGNDTLKGNAGNDVLDGGAGDDWLEGKAGEDVYVFGKGYGHDTVYALDSVSGGRDTVRLAGLNPDDVEFSIVTLTRSGGVTQDLVITIKETGETMTIYAGADPNYGSYNRRHYIRTVEFGDGTVWDYADIFNNGIVGSDGDDVMAIKDSNYSGILHGRSGNDTLTGNNGADQLYGGDGDDKLYGNGGDDVLVGGAGNDYLQGGAGDDTYIFGWGDGQDTINNAGGGNDLLSFTDIDPAELWFGKSGNHLVIGLIGGSDQVTVNNWYATGDYKIDQIETGDSYLVESQVAQLVQAMAAIGSPGGADGQWTEEQREALTPVLSTYWQPRV